MDPASQGLLGAAVVQSTLPQTGKAKLWLIAIFAAMAADLDMVIRSSDNPLLFFYFHRHFTHSLAFIPIAAVFLTGLFLLIFKSYRKEWKLIFLAIFLAYGTHGLLDWCTSYGTVLLWPFSQSRYALDIISIIDPIFTAFLLLGVVISAVNNTPLAARVALTLCFLYLGFGTWQNYRALQQQQLLASNLNETILRGRTRPRLGSLLHWHSFAITNKKIQLATITTPLFSSSYYINDGSTPLFTQDQLPSTVLNNPIWLKDFKLFRSFSDGYMTKFSSDPLIIVDARYLLISQPPRFAIWGIEFPKNSARKHVYWRNMIKQQ